MSQQSFASYFEQDYPKVVLYLMKIGARRADAEDGAQEAMARALVSWSSIANPAAWVRKVASRCYLDDQRKRMGVTN